MVDGPCNWEIDTSCVAEWDNYSEATQQLAYYLSTYQLWALTGRRFGRCEITVQPCRQKRRMPLYQVFPVPAWGYGYDGGYGGPYMSGGNWFNGCGGGCRCRARCEIELDGPTTTAGVLQVTVRGEIVDPDAYQIQNNYLLVRIDGECWPTCVDYSKQDPPEFTVTYLRGEQEPRPLQYAAGILAGEYAKACEGDDSCRLPSRMTSMSRQGVTVQVAQMNEYIDMGMTEIPEVDQIVVNLNPNRLTERPRVLSPDRPHPRMVT